MGPATYGAVAEISWKRERGRGDREGEARGFAVTCCLERSRFFRHHGVWECEWRLCLYNQSVLQLREKNLKGESGKK
jgi:hypothetical protein